MFDWITKIFNSKPNEKVELSEDEKKRSGDDFMAQAVIFSSAKHELNPNGLSDSSDAGSSDDDGGGGGGGGGGDGGG